MHAISSPGSPSKRQCRRALCATLLAAILAISQTQQALAQQTRFIIGTAPGGAIDAYARVVAEHMSQTLQRSIIIENKPGASSNLAAQYVADAPADGATIFVGTMAVSEINPHIFEHPHWAPKDFLPLIKGVDAPLLFTTHPDVPAKTFDEFLTWARANKGKLTYSSYSPGTPSHFLGALLNEKFALDLGHVPYRGSAPQTVDLLAGHAKFGFTQVQGVQPQIAAGKLRALAVTTDARFEQMPDIPSMKELGHPEFTAGIWFGLLIRAATPTPVTTRLLAAANAAHADPKVRAALVVQGFNVSGQTGEAFAKSIAEGSARWAKIIAATGFKATSD